VAWTRDGITNSPAAWLTTIAKRRAIDAVRRQATLRAKLPLLDESEATMEDDRVIDEAVVDDWHDAVPDERLRLVFLCCHPALAPEAQIALTLRRIGGVSTAGIAPALLVSEPTMPARLTRAKQKISVARIPLRVPRPAELPDRLQMVLGVILWVPKTPAVGPVRALDSLAGQRRPFSRECWRPTCPSSCSPNQIVRPPYLSRAQGARSTNAAGTTDPSLLTSLVLVKTPRRAHPRFSAEPIGQAAREHSWTKPSRISVRSTCFKLKSTTGIGTPAP
jgi:hypothetical protein